MEGFGIDVNQKKWVREPSPDPSGIYQREMEQGGTEYVLAFAGTNDNNDWKQDLNNFFAWGSASQYGNAITIGNKFASFYDGYEKTIVGHSLGGGLATAAAMATGIKAITFNPASMSDYTKNQLCIQNASDKNITNYVVWGEPLSFIQNAVGMSLPGNTIYLDAPKSSFSPITNSIKAHRIETIKNILVK